MNVYELIEKTKANILHNNHKEYNKYWLSLQKELNIFFNSDNVSEQDKNLLKRKGLLERVWMICEGIRYKEEQEKLKQQSK